MKLKIVIILILFLFGNTFISSGNFISESISKKQDDKDCIEIRVALYTDEVENEEFHSPYKRTRYFLYALRNYSWTVDDTTYRFTIDLFPTKLLYKGELSKDNYDVLLFPASTSENKFSVSLSRLQPRNQLEKKMISNFIKEGGGYFGSCGGALVACKTSQRPKTLFEYLNRNYMLGISAIKIEHEYRIPLLRHLIGQYNKVTPGLAYYFYSGANQTNYDINYHTATCVDVNISKDHPIFNDFVGNKRKIRWINGPKLIIPENSDREIHILGRYPEEEMSDNKSTQIHHWKYTGGISGIIKGIFPAGNTFALENLGVFFNLICYSGDWEPTDEVVETNLANGPFMTAEIYPNENKGRIVLCSGHPEHNVWWGGHIEKVEDVEYNTIYEGLYRWKDIIPEEETEEDEFSYNYCIIRRSVAWASKKVPENNLPPVYGDSEVCDFELKNMPAKFNVSCIVKKENKPVELNLYYRYSNDNVTWSNWTLFSKDNDSSNGFNFEFTSPNGSGYYQFYSKRVVDLGESYNWERIPPGADAWVYVEAN